MTAYLSGVFNLQQFDSIGALGVGMRLYTYIQGTTTHKAAYTDEAGTIPHTYTSDGIGGQYIAMNARGELPAPLFLTSGAYDLCLKTSAGATVWTRYAKGADDTEINLADTTSASNGAGMVGFASGLTYAAGTVGAALNSANVLVATLAANLANTASAGLGAGMVGFASGLTYAAGTVGAALNSATQSAQSGYTRRRVPAAFVRGDGNTRTDIFPLCVKYSGPGGVEVNKTPLDIARSLGNVIARQNDADVWVSPNGAGTFAGTSRANAMTWAAALRTLITGRKLLLVDDGGTYPPLSLISGTHAGAAVPKWLQSVDGRVRMAADTALGQPAAQTWTAHTGSIYKTVLSSVDYDRPQCVLAALVPDARDGQPKSILKYASVAELTALGSGGEGWYFDAATDTLYLTYYGNDLTVLGNRNFKIIYSSKTLDSTGDFSAEWLLGGATVIIEGNFELDGISINSYEANSTLPILLSEGRLQQLCATSFGLRVEGLTYTSGRRCYRSQYDGLNAYKSSMSSSTGMTIEHDIVVIGAGDIGTYGTAGPHNNQGFSAHGKHNAMIFGALFEGNDGQGWADICDSTHYSASWGVGVITRDNYVDTVSYGIYMDGSAGGGTGGRSAWLDTCASEGNTRDLAAIASAVKISNCQLTTQITASGGGITTYSPVAP